MKLDNMKPLADHVSVILVAVSGVASTLAPTVSVVAGVVGSIWGCIRIYEWIKTKRVPPINED